MSQVKNDGPAFPVAYGGGRIEGMTLRDYFAAKAMQGLMDAAMPSCEIAQVAYELADAMLAARSA